jgi:glutamyl endopeptidase
MAPWKIFDVSARRLVGLPGHGNSRRRPLIPRVERVEDRLLLSVIPPTDDRTLVSVTRSYPFSAIVNLEVTYRDGELAAGTGALLDPSHVLTAGHIVYDRDHGGLATEIQVIPGLDGSATPFGSAFARTVHTYASFRNDHKQSFDLALLNLYEPIDTATGSFRLRSEPNSFFRNRRLFTAGYPDDLEVGRMYAAFGQTVNATPTLVKHEIDTEHGDSGSPLWEYRKGAPFIVAVHTEGEGTINIAVRINQSKMADIRRWIKQDHALTIASLKREGIAPANGVAHLHRNVTGSTPTPSGAISA